MDKDKTTFSIQEVILVHGEHLKKECLADDIILGPIPEGLEYRTIQLPGMVSPIRIAIEKLPPTP